LAKSLHDSGAVEEAISTLARYCSGEVAPPFELVSTLGIFLDDEGRYTEAERHHRAAAALAPSRASIHNNLGYNLLLQGKFAESVASFRRAVALDPHSELARNNLGLALAMLPGGDQKEAVLQWQSVSDPATAHSNLASVLIEQKRYAEARKELEIALSYSRSNAAALGNLALLGELDGVPVSAVLPLRTTSWQRFTSGLRRALAGTKSETATGARPSAPGQAASK
jgi:Flp pilus assembly protein TadD